MLLLVETCACCCCLEDASAAAHCLEELCVDARLASESNAACARNLKHTYDTTSNTAADGGLCQHQQECVIDPVTTADDIRTRPDLGPACTNDQAYLEVLAAASGNAHTPSHRRFNLRARAAVGMSLQAWARPAFGLSQQNPDQSWSTLSTSTQSETLTVWFQQVHNGAHLVLPALNLQRDSGVTHVNDVQTEYLNKITQLTALRGSAADLHEAVKRQLGLGHDTNIQSPV
jgi:hypothetical protein